MKPINFICQVQINMSIEGILDKVADVSQWSDFDGYWFFPGIKSAEYETKTVNKIGSRIAVINSDGSHHIEEDWHFKNNQQFISITREFMLYPKSNITRPFL